jgi:sugar/nucleoside kinase (ribokinase family)
MDNTETSFQPLLLRRSPVIIGTGLVALDVVIPDGLPGRPHLCAGGTCGNVLTALAFLGWESYPIARLSTASASKHVADDMKQWNVKLDFVTFEKDGSTPVLIQRILNGRNGGRVHSFSRKCPRCGTMLPWYKAVRVSEISNILPRLPDAQVVFFDRTSRGALTLAKKGRDEGAIVFFEPSASSDQGHLQEALNLAHIVKISSDRLKGNEAVLTATKPKVVIETQGSSGLRLRLNTTGQTCNPSEWFSMGPVPAKTLRDTAGAGDWCSAGIIHMLGAKGAHGIEDLDLEDLCTGIHFGQVMASWACGFDGPRGGMYQTTLEAFPKKILDLFNVQIGPIIEARKLSVSTCEQQLLTCELCAAGSRAS